MTTLTYTEKLCVVVCPTCHIRHAIPAELDNRALERTQATSNTLWIYCPSGHQWAYTGKSEAQKEREKRERAEADAIRLRQRLDQAKADAEHERKRAQGYQGAMAKAKKRAAKGVCPAPGCKRAFVDVARHVATQHPDFVEAQG